MKSYLIQKWTNAWLLMRYLLWSGWEVCPILMTTWWGFIFLIVNNKWGENEGTIGEFTLTTSNGYVETVAPSFAIAPTKKTFLKDRRMLIYWYAQLGKIYNEAGIVGFWKGVIPALIMVSLIICFIWCIKFMWNIYIISICMGIFITGMQSINSVYDLWELIKASKGKTSC